MTKTKIAKKMYNEKVLILGATGLLGRYLAVYLSSNGSKVYSQSRFDKSFVNLNPLSSKEIAEFVRDVGITAIVNAAAATDVDRCEEDYEYAFQANVGIPKA